MCRAALFAALILFTVAAAFGDLEGVFSADIDHPAIQYAKRPVTDPVSQLNLRIQQGAVHLKFDSSQGYLRSVLDALNVPIESQMLAFSKTSIQMVRISPTNPRSIFFNDSIAVGWVRGGPIVELASEDPKQGVIFYTLDEKPSDRPQFTRKDECLSCHESYSSLGVPGMLVRSVLPAPNGAPVRELGDYITDDRSPFAQRWGGWYVTGSTGSMPHMGNSVFTNEGRPQPMLTGTSVNSESLKTEFDTSGYLSPFSDVVALMVFEHEMHMINLFTRVGWEVRLALYEDATKQSLSNHHEGTARLLRDTSREVVDYMLFVDEAPLSAKIQGSSGFAEKFSMRGPTDSKARSLRQFDLEHRLMRYPCSYMIYSQAFDSLPDKAKEAIYARMWRVLSGQVQGERYSKLAFPNRKAIVEILRDTKVGLPDYFQLITQ